MYRSLNNVEQIIIVSENEDNEFIEDINTNNDFINELDILDIVIP